MGSALVGDLFGAFVIANVNETTFYTIMTLFCIVSSLFFLLLRTPIKVSEFKESKYISYRSVI